MTRGDALKLARGAYGDRFTDAEILAAYDRVCAAMEQQRAQPASRAWHRVDRWEHIPATG